MARRRRCRLAGLRLSATKVEAAVSGLDARLAGVESTLSKKQPKAAK